MYQGRPSTGLSAARPNLASVGSRKKDTVTKSRLLKKLRAGGFVRVLGVNRVMEPWMTEAAGKLGYDVVWLDMEHRHYGYDVIDPISLACRTTGMDLMIRFAKSATPA